MAVRTTWMRRGAWLVLGLLTAFGLSRLRFDTEVLNLLPPGLSVAEGLKQHQRNFTDARQLLVTVEAASATEAAAAAARIAETLRLRTNLVANVDWQPPWVEHPGEMAEILAYLRLQQSPDSFAALEARLDPARLDATLVEARERLATSMSPEELLRVARDPLGLAELEDVTGAGSVDAGQGAQVFASGDGRFRVVFAEASPELDSYRACADWLRQVRELVDEERQAGRVGPGVEVRMTGRPVFVTEIAMGMESDMSGSMSGTLGVIGLLFWLTHRCWRPLLLLLVALVLVQVATLAGAGLALGRINVVSLGFAAILFGLAEDFGIVIFEEARAHPDLDVAGLRRRVLPGITWSAVTTAGAFGILRLSHLPGLVQLGSLVALGVLVAAAVMVLGYLPLVLRWVRDGRSRPVPATGLFRARWSVAPGRLRVWTLLLAAAACAVLVLRPPSFDRSPQVLAPRHSEARETLERLRDRLGGGADPVWLIVQGKDTSEVGRRLDALDERLAAARAEGLLGASRTPSMLWPRPERAAINLDRVRGLLRRREAFREGLDRAGFQPAAASLGEGVLAAWAEAVRVGPSWRPRGHTARWMFRQVFSESPGTPLAMGWVVRDHAGQPPSGRVEALVQGRLRGGTPLEGVTVCGWDLLGERVFELALLDLPRVLGPVVLLVLVALACAFRRVGDILLCVAALGFSGLLLAAAMGLAGLRWNLMNLMAIPLALGMGVDFCIHMQLALWRHGGDVRVVRDSIGRALLLAGSTTIAGFGSLAFSSNAGLSSLGLVCSLGIASAMVSAIFLLPAWWSPGARRPAG